MINQQLADREHLRPGGTLHLIGHPQRGPSPDIAHAERLALRVSAIVVFDDQIVSAAGERPQPWLLLSQAFARTRQAASFNRAGGGASVLLRPGAGAAAFGRGATALAARYRVGKAEVINLATGHAAAQRAIRPQAAALAVFAGARGPDRAGHHRAAAQPPARPRLGGIPDPARPRHDQVPPGRTVAGQGRDHNHRRGCRRGGGLPSRRPR